jgi:hypothetical protein
VPAPPRSALLCRPLLVLHAIRQGVTIDRNDPDLHVGICTFFNRFEQSAPVSTGPAPPPTPAAGSSDAKSAPAAPFASDPIVRRVIETERNEFKLTDGLSAAAYNAQYLRRNAESMRHRLAGTCTVAVDDLVHGPSLCLSALC